MIATFYYIMLLKIWSYILVNTKGSDNTINIELFHITFKDYMENHRFDVDVFVSGCILIIAINFLIFEDQQ